MASRERRSDLLTQIAASQPPDTIPAGGVRDRSLWPEPDEAGAFLLSLGLRRTGSDEYSWSAEASRSGRRPHLVVVSRGQAELEWRFSGLDDDWLDHPLLFGSRFRLPSPHIWLSDAVGSALIRVGALLDELWGQRVVWASSTLICHQYDPWPPEVERWFVRFVSLAQALRGLGAATAELDVWTKDARTLRRQQLMSSLFSAGDGRRDRDDDVLLPSGANRRACLAATVSNQDAVGLAAVLTWALPLEARRWCAESLLGQPPSAKRARAASSAAKVLLNSHSPTLVALGVRLVLISDEPTQIVAARARVLDEGRPWVGAFDDALGAPFESITAPISGALALARADGGELSLAPEAGAVSLADPEDP